MSIILYFIHKREKLKAETQLEYVIEYDRGVFWLAAAVFLWSIAGIITIVISENYFREFARISLSTINSACFILAVAYFDYGPSWLKFIQQDEKLHKSFIIIAGIVAGLIYLLIWLIVKYVTKTGIHGLKDSIESIDVVLAVFTLYVLFVGLEESFKRRKFKDIVILARTH